MPIKPENRFMWNRLLQLLSPEEGRQLEELGGENLLDVFLDLCRRENTPDDDLLIAAKRILKVHETGSEKGYELGLAKKQLDAGADYAVITVEPEIHGHLVTHSVGLSRLTGFEYVCIHEQDVLEYRAVVQHLCECSVRGVTHNTLTLRSACNRLGIADINEETADVDQVDPRFLDHLKMIDIHLTRENTVKFLTPSGMAGMETAPEKYLKKGTVIGFRLFY